MKEELKEIKYTAKNDKIFKTIVLNENNYELLEAIISDAMGEKVKIIKYLLPELKVRNAKERTKRLDVVVEALGALYNVELNTGTGKAMRVRNFNFFTSFYSQNTIAGNEYETKTKFIHIDLTYNMSKNYPIKNVYKLKNEESTSVYIDNFEVIEINMDKLRDSWYDKEEKIIEKYKHLIMLDLKKIEELEQLSKGDKIVETFKDEVVKLNRNYTFVRSISPEEDEILIANTEKRLARESGYEEGKLEAAQETAKKFLMKGISVDVISECTGLTKEQLEKLKIESNE